MTSSAISPIFPQLFYAICATGRAEHERLMLFSPRKLATSTDPEQLPMLLKISSSLTVFCVTQIAIVLVASPAGFAASKPFPVRPDSTAAHTHNLTIPDTSGSRQSHTTYQRQIEEPFVPGVWRRAQKISRKVS